MRFLVLGSLEVLDNSGTAVDLTSRRQRQLLAALLIRSGSLVSDARLTEMVWGEDQLPEGGVRALRTVVSRLRMTLEPVGVGSVQIFTKPTGYVLELHGATIDAADFEEAVWAGHRHLSSGDNVAALGSFDEALSYWRGAAYAEFADEPWALAEVARLDELRATAAEGRMAARLATGDHAELVGELERLVTETPYRERPREQLMIALYRSGRQPDALRAYRDYRQMLADEMGLDPSAAMQELELRILQQDPALSAPAARPTRIKSYELIEKIGEGSWGEVWRARQASVDRDVAVKVIHSELADDEAFIRRFEVEARIVAGLEHPHIVPLYDFWRDPSGGYLVMRLLRGGSTAERTRHGGPWPLAAVSLAVEQLGGALSAAHRAGVMHRDVKPSNVLLDEDGNAYLADFGVAFDAALGAPGEPAGSPGYAPPEQLAGSPVGPSADVYGLAMTVRELLCGGLADVSQPIGSLLETGRPVEVRSVRVVRPDVPAAVDDVLRVATHPDPLHRHQSIGDFVEAFRGAASSTPVGAFSGVPVQVVGGTFVPGRDVVNPYKGLRAFGAGDAADFFGRDDLIDQIVDTIDHHHFVAVVGPSGAGKSSVVRAGVLPALRAGRLPGAAEWFVITMQPGANPFEELEAALLHVAVNPPASLLEQLEGGSAGIARAVKRTLPGQGRELLIVIDQFEELFTQTDPVVADRFVDGIAAAVRDPRAAVRVIVTLRADFFDRPLTDHRIASLMVDSTVPVGAMSLESLAAAITGPAARAGLVVEPGLVDALVADANGETAALPLLQYMLTELFDRRSGAVLELDAYRSLGGVSGVIAQRAEEVFSDLSESGREAARRVFGRLVTVGDDLPDSRRRARRAELLGDASPVETGEVLDRFGGSRLLAFDRDPTTRESTVEIAHEAMLVAWPRLRSWIDDDRELLRTMAWIRASATEWQREGCDSGALLRGARLSAAVEFEAKFAERLAPTEATFIDTSRAAFEHGRLRERRQNRRLRAGLVGAAILLVVSVVAGLAALQQRAHAKSTAFDAQTRRLVAESARVAESDPSLASLLAVEAVRRERSPDTLGALQRVYAHLSPAFLGSLVLGQDNDAAFLPDGSLVSATNLALRRIDMQTRSTVWSVPRSYRFVAASTTGEIIVAVEEASGGDRWSVLDAATGAFRSGGGLSPGETITAVTIFPDGSQVALATTTAGDDPARQIVVATAGGGIERRIDASVVESEIHTIVVDGEQTRIAVAGDGGAVQFDAASGEVVGQPIRVGAHGVGVSYAKGRLWVATDGLQAYDVDLGSAIGAPVPFDLPVVGQQRLVVSEVGSAMVVASLEGAVAIGTDDHATQSIPLPRSNLVTRVVIDPHEGVLARMGGSLGFWALDGSGIGVVATVPQLGGHSQITSNGRRLVVVGPRQVDIWAVGDDPELLARLALGTADSVLVVENDIVRFVQDGDDPSRERVELWSEATRTFNLLATLPITTSATSVAVSSELLAVGRFGGTVDVLARDGGARVAELLLPTENTGEGDRGVFDVEFAPDGRSLVAATATNAVGIYDTATWEATVLIPAMPENLRLTGNGFEELAFTPDGRFVATQSVFTGLQIRSAEAIAVAPARAVRIARPLHLTRVVDVSSDGRIVEVSGPDGVRLVDVATLEPIGDPYPYDAGTSSFAPAATYAREADLLATTVGDSIIIWHVDPGAWLADACKVAGRNLSREEWARFGLGGTYRRTCSQFGEQS